MLLGAVFEKLYPVPLFILNVCVSLIVLTFVFLRGGTDGVLSELRDKAAGFFTLVIGDKVLLVIFALFAAAVCWLVLLVYLFPSYSWDALYYHLPIAGQILQSGAIKETHTPSFIQQYMNIFSKDVNLFFLWNIIFLKSDVIVDISQFCFVIAGVLSIYSMSVKLGVKEKYAVYAALLFFFTPIILLQSTINYVDAAVSMLFIIAVNFLMYDVIKPIQGFKIQNSKLNTSNSEYRIARGERRGPLIIGGLAAGILLGSKASGPVFIAVICAAIFIHAVYTSKVNSSRADSCFRLFHTLKDYAVFFALPMMIIGGYWYIRNWIFYGNPVYFMDVSVFNVTLFKGLKSDWAEPAPQIIGGMGYLSRLIYVWLEKVQYYMYDSRLSGFGPLWFILYLPSIVFSLIYALVKKKYAYLFIAVIFTVTFIVHPRNWFTRYVMFITGLGAVSFAVAFDYFAGREKILKIIVLLLAGYTFVTVTSPCIMPSKVKEFLSLPPEERTLTRHKPFNIDEKVRDKYGYWIWIERNIKKGDTLAYTYIDEGINISDPFLLGPLWNRQYSNRVMYVKADTYKEWTKRLNDNNVNYILLKTGSVEDEWVNKERKLYYAVRWTGSVKEKFGIVYSDEKYRIVRLLGS